MYFYNYRGSTIKQDVISDVPLFIAITKNGKFAKFMNNRYTGCSIVKFYLCCIIFKMIQYDILYYARKF